MPPIERRLCFNIQNTIAETNKQTNKRTKKQTKTESKIFRLTPHKMWELLAQ